MDKAIQELERNVCLVGIPCTGQITEHNISSKNGLAETIDPEALSKDEPILISAPTGMGKSTFVTTTLAQYASEHGHTILFVSSRVAICAQQKKGLARSVGEKQLLDELTSKGWRTREEIGCVTVMTYHRLFSLTRSREGRKYLKTFDFFVLDEVHALRSDALFTPCTGELLDCIPRVFSDAVRIYMTATPDSIEDAIAASECKRTLQVYTWRAVFDWVKPFFFSQATQLVDCINADKSDSKWLVFIDGIEAGVRFSQQLKVSSTLLNSRVREKDPEAWDKLLDTEQFEAKVLVTTNVLDCGVNFKDPLLRKIVSFSYDKDEILQQLGRKRRNQDEQVELYLYDEPPEIIRRKIRNLTNMQAALELWNSPNGNAEFLSRFIYGDELPQVRKLFSILSDGKPVLNSLAQAKIADDVSLLSSFETATKGGGFPKYICKALHQKVPADPTQWLDGRKNGTAEAAFESFLQKWVGKPISVEEQKTFSNSFRLLYTEAFGKTSGDRADRAWQATAIRNRLTKLNRGYTLEVKDYSWEIIKFKGDI